MARVASVPCLRHTAVADVPTSCHLPSLGIASPDAGKCARRATERELRVLVSHLEASLMEDAGIDLDPHAIEEHREIVASS